MLFSAISINVAGVGDNLSRFMNGGDVRINVIL